MNLSSFKLDIDELITEFTKVTWLMIMLLCGTDWVVFIAFTVFMKLNHLNLLSEFIYRLLKKLMELAVDAKDIKVVPALVKRMLERNMLLFSAVDLKEGSVAETVTQFQELQQARLEAAYETLFGDTKTEHFIRMDLGMEVDLNAPKDMSSEYAEAKNVAIREASNVMDVQKTKHISEDKGMIGNVVEKIADDWLVQKESFYKQTGLGDDEGYGQGLEQLLLTQDGETNEDDRHESES